jgi:hypothetical protein
MNAPLKADHSPQDAMAASNSAGGDLRKIAPLEVTLTGKFRSETDDDASEVSTVIARMANITVVEIDQLLTELQRLRDYLQTEGERIQRDATRYAEVNQTALASVRIINDSMASWKSNTRARR